MKGLTKYIVCYLLDFDFVGSSYYLLLELELNNMNRVMKPGKKGTFISYFISICFQCIREPLAYIVGASAYIYKYKQLLIFLSGRFHTHQLNIEHQISAWRDGTRNTPFTISQRAWNLQFSFFADAHTSNTLIPTFNDSANT